MKKAKVVKIKTHQFKTRKGPDGFWEDQRKAMSSELDGVTVAECLPGTFGCHELLDRVANHAQMVEDFVMKHPACITDPEWFALAAKAVDALNDLYQKIGGAHLITDDDEVRHIDLTRGLDDDDM